ncbi:MAG: hypothetical protein ACE5PM_03910 [Candidatus Hydrothermarchaeales archaeon]
MFEKRTLSAKFFSSLKDFQLDTQHIEYRRDAIFDRWCRINVERPKRVKQGSRTLDYAEFISRSLEGCFFCPKNIDGATPKFTPGIAPEGRMRLGESWVFPNLFPFAQHHAIATITEKHFLKIDEFTERQVEDTLKASLDYFRRVNSADEKVKYATFNWNYLPPSGASIVHPHAQLIADPEPPYLTGMYLDASERYYREHRENYWLKLIKEEEEAGERFIGHTGEVAWFTSFVPLGNNEVNAVFEEASTLTDISEKDISDLSRGVIRVLHGYAKLGVESFNITSYSAPLNEGAESFRLNFKFISRPDPQEYYTADAGFMEILHHERVVEAMPEEVAIEMRKFFG